jgi:hypothetical protein
LPRCHDRSRHEPPVRRSAAVRPLSGENPTLGGTAYTPPPVDCKTAFMPLTDTLRPDILHHDPGWWGVRCLSIN